MPTAIFLSGLLRLWEKRRFGGQFPSLSKLRRWLNCRSLFAELFFPLLLLFHVKTKTNKNIRLVGQAWADQLNDRISFCFFFSFLSDNGVWKHYKAFFVHSFWSSQSGGALSTTFFCFPLWRKRDILDIFRLTLTYVFSPFSDFLFALSLLLHQQLVSLPSENCFSWFWRGYHFSLAEM